MALRRLLWNPNELGVAAAYVLGEIDVDRRPGRRPQPALVAGREPPRSSRSNSAPPIGSGPSARRADIGAFGPQPAAPTTGSAARRPICTARTGTEPRSRHHYDLSNDFYELILDPNMAYSCGVLDARRRPDVHAGRRAGRQARPDLPQARSAPRHAPARRGLRLGLAVAVRGPVLRRTGHRASRCPAQQHAFVAKRAADRRLTDLVDVRQHGLPGHQRPAVRRGGHHRDGRARRRAQLPDSPPAFTLCKPGGRLLVQQMSRGTDRARRRRVHRGLHRAGHAHAAGWRDGRVPRDGPGLRCATSQAMREHYVQDRARVAGHAGKALDDAVELVGEPTARVWRLYLVGGALAFAEGRMGVDQILAVRPDDRRRKLVPASPTTGRRSCIWRQPLGDSLGRARGRRPDHVRRRVGQAHAPGHRYRLGPRLRGDRADHVSIVSPVTASCGIARCRPSLTVVWGVRLASHICLSRARPRRRPALRRRLLSKPRATAICTRLRMVYLLQAAHHVVRVAADPGRAVRQTSSATWWLAIGWWSGRSASSSSRSATISWHEFSADPATRAKC